MEFNDLQGNRNQKALSRYIKQLELLCLQFGVNPNEIELVLKQMIKTSRTERETDRISVYRIALEVLGNHLVKGKEQELSKDGSKLFLYEEDQNFHLAVTHMPFELRVPYILTEFHHFSIAETKEVSNQTEEELYKSVLEAEKWLQSKLHLQPDQYEKAIEFMKKTYNRLPGFTESKQLFSKNHHGFEIVQEIQEEKKEKSTLVKQMIGATVAVIFFISLFYISSTNNGRVDEQYVKNLDEEFQEVLDERRDQLGLSQTVYIQQPFMATARSLYRVFQIEVNKSIDSKDPMKRKDAREKFEEIIESFQLPSEMVVHVKDEPLARDEEASLKFMDMYAKRLHEIRNAYYREIYSPNSSQTRETLIEGMEKQNYYFDDTYSIIYKKSETTNTLRSSLHPSASPYIELLGMEHKYYRPELLDPTEIANDAMMLEGIVLNDARRAYLYDLAKSLYHQTFSALTYAPSIYQKDMTIKKEYKDLWEMQAGNHLSSPMGKLFHFILGDTQRLRTMHSFLELESAISLAQTGKLSTYSDGERMIESMDQYATVQLPDDEFTRGVNMLIEKIERNTGYGSLSSTVQNPLVIVGAYDAAQREGDWNALWQLTLKYHPIETFKELYPMGEPILEGVDRMVFDPEFIHGQSVAPIFFEKAGETEVGVWVSRSGLDWVVEKVVESKPDN